MTKKLTLGYVPYGTGTVSPFDQVFENAHAIDPSKPKEFDDCDAIVVWGGGDISPSLYGHPVSDFTGADDQPSGRDRYEAKCMTIAIAKDIPIIGVCRGAQLACAMAGGCLIQHVEGHHSDHSITTKDEEVITTSSVHHQMMYPWKVQHELLAWSTKARSNTYLNGLNKEIDMNGHLEPEVVYFPSIRALAIQGHPEFMNANSRFVQYCNELVKTYLLENSCVVE